MKVCKDRRGGSQAFQYLGVLHHPAGEVHPSLPLCQFQPHLPPG